MLFVQITEKSSYVSTLYFTCDARKFQNMYKDNDPAKTFTWQNDLDFDLKWSKFIESIKQASFYYVHKVT